MLASVRMHAGRARSSSIHPWPDVGWDTPTASVARLARHLEHRGCRCLHQAPGTGSPTTDDCRGMPLSQGPSVARWPTLRQGFGCGYPQAGAGCARQARAGPRAYVARRCSGCDGRRSTWTEAVSVSRRPSPRFVGSWSSRRTETATPPNGRSGSMLTPLRRCDEVGLPWIGAHGLRHTCATATYMRGVASADASPQPAPHPADPNTRPKTGESTSSPSVMPSTYWPQAID